MTDSLRNMSISKLLQEVIKKALECFRWNILGHSLTSCRRMKQRSLVSYTLSPSIQYRIKKSFDLAIYRTRRRTIWR